MAIDYPALNALTTQWAAQKADIDDRENRLKINYNNVLDKMKTQLTKSGTGLAENLADRGLRQSGIAAKSEMDMQTDYNKARAQTAEKQTLDLATIARKRLEADAAYNAQKLIIQTPAPAR
jgi:parvulin-like peptidyl-prolyl isomerase